MGSRPDLKRALVALAALASLAIATGAEAQKRRLPSRTEEVPDTESGRPAASAANPTFKGRMSIFGPPSLPVGMPPDHSKPAPVAEPATSPPAPAAVAAPAPPPAPAPVIAAPAPTPQKPAAPLVAPAPQVPAPIAIPLPAPAPAAPVAKPAPAVAPAPVIAAPTPAPVPAAPPVVAAPAPRPEPIVRPEPPRAAPIVAPVIAAPVIAPSSPKPAPAAPPRQDVAMAAPSSAASAPVPIAMDAKLIENIFACLAPGLPQDWKKTWIVVTGPSSKPSAKFYFTNTPGDDQGEELVPCSAQALTQSITGLNDKLPADRRAWNKATLTIESDGEYELSYDYPK
jgi:hypothetical protein